MNNLQALTLDSREVAKMLPKRHSDLLRDIATYSKYLSDFNERNFALVDFFQESSYQDSKGEIRKCYLITKKGCEFIAHKMTGRKGALFTATYINRFHEMEQALKERQTAAPAPATVSIPPRVTYRGELLMTAVHLHKLMKMSNATLQVRAKKHNLRYVRLVTDELRAFKKENHRLNCAACVVLYPKDTVVALLKQFNQYEALLPVIHEYFKSTVPAPVSPPAPITLDALAIDNTVKDLSQKAETLSGLLQNLNSYRRTKERHAEYVSITLEFAASLFSGLSKIKRKVEAMNA